MSNPTGPDQPDEAAEAAAEAIDETDETQKAEAVTDPEHEPATEILLSPEAEAQLPAEETNQPAERRFTAPSGFDAGSTQVIDTPADPATEVMSVPDAPAGVAAATAFTEPMAHQKPVAPQVIPPRTDLESRRAPVAAGAGWWPCCWSSPRWWPSRFSARCC